MSKYEEATATRLASGAYGFVQTITRSWDQKEMVRKIITYSDKDPKGKEYQHNEYRTQTYLDHPNIARYTDAEWLDGEVRFYMDYFEDGSLDTLIKKHHGDREYKVPKNDEQRLSSKLPQEDVWAIAYQLSAAVAYCHDAKKRLRVVPDDESDHLSMGRSVVLHRDIKPQNVLRAKKAENSLETLKLCDFGLAFVVEGSKKAKSYAGTRQYMAPEIKNDGEQNREWTPKCDIYSLGCTLYEVCQGKPPHIEGPPRNETEAKKYTTIDHPYDDDLRNCIRKCLQYCPQDRPEAAWIYDKAKENLGKSTNKYKGALKNTFLLDAIATLKSVDEITDLIGHPPEVQKFTDSRGYTPLHRAVEYRRIDVVKRLLDLGFNVLAGKEISETPLYLALQSMESNEITKFRNQAQELSSLLVDRSINIDANIWFRPFTRGWTLLHLAAAAGSTEIVKRVLEKTSRGWTSRVINKEWTLMHIAARTGHVDLLKCLIERDRQEKTAMIEAYSSDEATPLFAASKFGRVAAVDLLLQEKAHLDARPKGKVKIRSEEKRAGLTVLHVAAFGGHTETVKSLLDASGCGLPFIKKVTDKSETALHLAVQTNNKNCSEIIATLVNRVSALVKEDHINSNARSENEKARFRQKYAQAIEAKGKNASQKFLGLTAEVGFKQQGRIIPRKKVTALHIAAANGNVAAVTKLLELGAEPDAQIQDGDTPLHLAARTGLKTIVQKLLAQKVSASTQNRSMCTSLHVAVESSPTGKPEEIEAMCEIVKVLINYDNELAGLSNEHGQTALLVAAGKGNLAIIEVLYDHNHGLLKKADCRGNTALHLAAENDCLKVVEFLLDHPSDIDVKRKNRAGKTPLDVAEGNSRDKLEYYG